jgi:carboxypeptidase C (cathepsin A)
MFWSMKVLIRLALVGSVLLLMVARTAFAQETAAPTTAPEAGESAESTRGPRGGFRGRAPDTAPATQPAEEQPAVTEHEITIDGQPLRYTATAAQIPLKDDAGKVRGRIFFIAYEKKREASDDVANRPVTFIFNGGPGAASVWLHLGTAGPKRVVLPDDGTPPAPPYRLDTNPHTWLDLTDLVFIDPVGTGFSRPAENERAREFYGVEGDVASVADFIRIYLTRYGRWASPKFLAGESYGTTRAAGLSEHLHDRFGIDLSGIVLVSTVLNFQTIQPSAGNDLPYPLFLPTYTASAWFHKKLPPELQGDLQKAVEQSQRWAIDQYMPALMKGTSLTEAERKNVAQKLAMYSGLPLEAVERGNLRISPHRFEKMLLADQRRVIGRMDGRITGHDADALDDTPDHDPSLTGYVGLFSETFNHYIRGELKYESELAYEFLSPRVHGWDFGPAGRGYLNVATTLRECMTKVPSMRVMLASGYYDLATPFGAADYTINQMPLSDELRANITHHYYEGGHMMYLNEPSLAKLKKDLASFYELALERKD